MNKKFKSQRIKNIAVLTLGCPKNVVDSEEFALQLRKSGMRITSDPEGADAMIINTCGFIAPAKEESVQAILEAVELKKSGGIKKLIVTGCLSQRYGESLREQIGEVDHFFGINSAGNILNALNGDFKRGLFGERILTPPHYAYLKISEGCDHPCSFCAIPLIRGRHISRPKEKIIAEASRLVSEGTKELILIAQDTTYYGKDLYGEKKLAGLAEGLSAIKGLSWLRIMYTYPAQFPFDMLEVMASRENICNYIDIPLQHISDGILKSMRRGMTRKSTEELICRIRDTVPGIAIRSTFITGYPGETERQFLELLDFIRDVKLDRVGVFTYSPEEDTPAYDLGDPVENTEKQRRMEELMKAQMKISLEKNKSLIGTEVKVLIDEDKDGKLFGRTEHDAPEIDNSVIIEKNSSAAPGDFVHVEVTDATDYDLYGKIS